MAKGNLLQDSFEQVVETGGAVAKRSAKQIGKTLDPLKMIEDVLGQEETQDLKNKKTEKDGDNHTPLNVDEMKKSHHKDKDQQQLDALRNKLFTMVKQGEEKVVKELEQKEKQKEQAEEQEKQAKKQREEEERRQRQQEEPRGKQRKFLFSKKKAAQREAAEVRPSTGKQ